MVLNLRFHLHLSVLTSPIRLNTKLESQGYQPMTSLVKDLSDGVRLIQLMVRPSFISQACSHNTRQEIMGVFHLLST